MGGDGFTTRPFPRARHDIVDALVDVVTLVEAEAGGVAIPHVLRAANRRTVLALHEEIRRVQAEPRSSAQRSGFFARLSPWVPGFARRLFLRALRRSPAWLKRTAGTALVTSVGRSGSGTGWAVGIVPRHTLALTVGGIARKPGVVPGAEEDHVEVLRNLAG